MYIFKILLFLIIFSAGISKKTSLKKTKATPGGSIMSVNSLKNIMKHVVILNRKDHGKNTHNDNGQLTNANEYNNSIFYRNLFDPAYDNIYLPTPDNDDLDKLKVRGIIKDKLNAFLRYKNFININNKEISNVALLKYITFEKIGFIDRPNNNENFINNIFLCDSIYCVQNKIYSYSKQFKYLLIYEDQNTKNFIHIFKNFYNYDKIILTQYSKTVVTANVDVIHNGKIHNLYAIIKFRSRTNLNNIKNMVNSVNVPSAIEYITFNSFHIMRNLEFRQFYTNEKIYHTLPLLPHFNIGSVMRYKDNLYYLEKMREDSLVYVYNINFYTNLTTVYKEQNNIMLEKMGINFTWIVDVDFIQNITNEFEVIYKRFETTDPSELFYDPFNYLKAYIDSIM